MTLTVSSDVTGPAAGHFLFLEENVGVRAGRDDVLRNGRNFGHFKQLLEGETLDGFANTFAVLAFFHPPVPDLFDDGLDFVEGFFRGDEGNEQGAHLSAVNDRGLGAAEDGRAAFVADVQGAGHGVDTVHATHAFGVVDEEALAEAIRNSQIRGAAVDVFSEEPPKKDNPLLKLEQVILTPHIGSNTVECMDRIALDVAEDVHLVLSGENPKHPIKR